MITIIVLGTLLLMVGGAVNNLMNPDEHFPEFYR